MIVNNSQDLNTLLSLVLDKLKDDDRFESILDHGPLEFNVFSITFWVKFAGSSGHTSVYVKIPKYIFYDKNINFLSPITKFDIELAVNESNSLDYLSKNWDESNNVFFIRKLAFIKEFNALVTERIIGTFFFEEYRKHDFSKKNMNQDHHKVIKGLYNFGKSLKYFHSKSSTKSEFKAYEIIKKINIYSNYLKISGVSPKYLKQISNKLKKNTEFHNPTFIAKNLKGIDIRQIFITNNHDLVIIDPGKISEGYIEIDIARFIVTCRILYWGTIKIFFQKVPNESFENNFLDGYYGRNHQYSKSLNLLIIKEYFKQWKVGHSALRERGWPILFKFIFKKIYMDPFYKRLILIEFEKLNQ